MITIRVTYSWNSYTQLHTDKQYRGVSIILNECVIAGVQNIKHVNKLIIGHGCQIFENLWLN